MECPAGTTGTDKNGARRRPPLFISVVFVILALAVFPSRFAASPRSQIRVVDEAGQPLAGLRIVRQWRTSEEDKGQDEAITDANGSVIFPRKMTSMSLLMRITKPLLASLPAICAPGSAVYGFSEFDVYGPPGYAPIFDAANWHKVQEVYENKGGICIRDPIVNQKFRHEDYIEFYFFSTKDVFDYTLALHKEQK